ncbi:hypothetical protein ALQ50_04556, partial [Pseudomonas coronafaciens pv. coronafaciens]
MSADDGICLALNGNRHSFQRRSGAWTTASLPPLALASGRTTPFFWMNLYEVRGMTERTGNALDWVGGSDAPEMNSLDVGFMALTDCAPLVVAATQGFAQPYGLSLNLKRQ